MQSTIQDPMHSKKISTHLWFKKGGGISFKHAIIKTLNMKQQQSFLPPAREHRIGNPLSISAQESGFDFRCFPLLTLDCLFLMACVL
jgi:hypothetical protein